jgi:hypothetical protein
MEGGGPTITCISWYQNNLGGVYLRQFNADLGGFAQGAPFVIRMDTCDLPAMPVSYPIGTQPSIPPSKRQATAGGLNMQGARAPLWVRDPRTQSEGFVFMPLSDSKPGIYNGTLGFSNTAGLEDIAILDGSGGSLWNNTGTWISGTRDVQYQVQDESQDLFVAAKASKSVSVSASFSATGIVRASSSSSSASRAHTWSRRCTVCITGGILIGIMWF